MRAFKTKPFARFANREEISDEVLCDAVQRAGRGAIDADLGGGVLKQRIARKGQGRSGGFRVIVLFRRGSARSLSTGLRKVIGRTFGATNSGRCGRWQMR